ncbi:MAG: hypothetical protein ABIU77_02755 [Ferruginibacter sp.]
MQKEQLRNWKQRFKALMNKHERTNTMFGNRLAEERTISYKTTSAIVPA